MGKEESSRTTTLDFRASHQKIDLIDQLGSMFLGGFNRSREVCY
jgi:hypothetical protein